MREDPPDAKGNTGARSTDFLRHPAGLIVVFFAGMGSMAWSGADAKTLIVSAIAVGGLLTILYYFVFPHIDGVFLSSEAREAIRRARESRSDRAGR